MKKYKSLYERRLNEFKAWYNPSTGEERIFDVYDEHRQHLDSDLEETFDNRKIQLKRGWFRIGVGSGDVSGEVDIQSFKKPTPSEIKKVQDFIEQNYFKNKVNGVYWEITNTKKGYLWNSTSFIFLQRFENYDEEWKV